MIEKGDFLCPPEREVRANQFMMDARILLKHDYSGIVHILQIEKGIPSILFETAEIFYEEGEREAFEMVEAMSHEVDRGTAFHTDILMSLYGDDKAQLERAKAQINELALVYNGVEESPGQPVRESETEFYTEKYYIGGIYMFYRLDEDRE